MGRLVALAIIMPELPEVESIVAQLRATPIVAAPIAACVIHCPALAASGVVTALPTTAVQQIDRRGKWMLFLLTSGEVLLVHLRMSGKWVLNRQAGMLSIHERACISFHNGWQLHFVDPRRFAKWVLTRHPEQLLHRLGPEPFDRQLDKDFFRLLRRRKAIKSLLLDQTFLAGIGNIYADESLWRAEIAPQCPAVALSFVQAERLLAAIRAALQQGLRGGGSSLGVGENHFLHPDGQMGTFQNMFSVYGRAGHPCPRCQTAIVKRLLGGRGTHFCPRCQR